jgi:hypothetical protein
MARVEITTRTGNEDTVGQRVRTHVDVGVLSTAALGLLPAGADRWNELSHGTIVVGGTCSQIP